MSETFQIRVVNSFTDIPAETWGRLAGAVPGRTGEIYNPFVSHAFLSALEESGSATAETGWLGQHMLLETGTGDLIGALPLYL